MDFDANSFLASLLVGAVGFVLFSYGRKMKRTPQVVSGLVLMLFPYFVSGPLLILAIGAALCALLVLALRLGY